jgi:hypothetical protein
VPATPFSLDNLLGLFLGGELGYSAVIVFHGTFEPPLYVSIKLLIPYNRSGGGYHWAGFQNNMSKYIVGYK